MIALFYGGPGITQQKLILKVWIFQSKIATKNIKRRAVLARLISPVSNNIRRHHFIVGITNSAQSLMPARATAANAVPRGRAIKQCPKVSLHCRHHKFGTVLDACPRYRSKRSAARKRNQTMPEGITSLSASQIRHRP
jgi:hypothetical protein